MNKNYKKLHEQTLEKTENERISKEIIKFLQLLHPQFVSKRNYEEWIAWLEKQGKNSTWSEKYKEVYQSIH